jgi:glycosyltransferase involved in cell wall biosynthesis
MRMPHRSKSRQVDTLVGVSQFVTRKLVDLGYFEGVRSVRTIPNVRDISKQSLPTQARPDDGQLVFGFIGRLSPSKGIEFLLETFSRSKLTPCGLIVAGRGEESYENRLKAKYGDSRISFLGEVPAHEFYTQVDCIVIPSLWEDTFPSVAFESLLYGRPILGSQIGGIPELVDSTNGRLFVPADSSDLESAMRWAIDNRKLLRQQFATIQKEAGRFADVKEWVARWSETYASAIASAHPELRQP